MHPSSRPRSLGRPVWYSVASSHAVSCYTYPGQCPSVGWLCLSLYRDKAPCPTLGSVVELGNASLTWLEGAAVRRKLFRLVRRAGHKDACVCYLSERVGKAISNTV